MKRSEIDRLIVDASECFIRHGWTLPPHPRWDVTDFGLGDWKRFGLILVNLAEEPEYCEKLMYAKAGMATPVHWHERKKEDIICRAGTLLINVWENAQAGRRELFQVKCNGVPTWARPGETLRLEAGERVTLEPGVVHGFEPGSDEVIIGEVSTANDDLNDNFFLDSNVGRFPEIEEDVPAAVKLVNDG